MKYDLSYIAAQILWEAHQEGEQGGGKGTADGGVTDDELVLQCQAELPYQIEAFETLVNRYRHKVFGKCLSMVKNTEDAYDVTQDIFIRVFNGIKNFKRKSSFSTWLYTITVNTCLNFIEKNVEAFIQEDVDAYSLTLGRLFKWLKGAIATRKEDIIRRKALRKKAREDRDNLQ